MDLPSIMDMDVRGKRLLVRADLNVPVIDGQVTDATRITRFADGMRPLLARGARLVILTHFGRPDAGASSEELSVSQLRSALATSLGYPVQFARPCTGASVLSASNDLQNGEVLLCENLRYHEGETINDMGFASELAKLGDIYVNDAFSVSHRSHASTDAVTHFLPSVAGPLVLEEVSALTAALDQPARPSVASVGGSKVSTTIPVLENLAGKLDHRAAILDVERGAFGDLRDAGIARRHDQLVAFGVLHHRPGQRVFAPAAAENEDIHGTAPLHFSVCLSVAWPGGKRPPVAGTDRGAWR